MGAKEDISLLELLLKDIHIYVQWRFTMRFCNSPKIVELWLTFKKRLLARPEEAMRNSVAITMYWTYWSNLHPTGICLRSNYFYSEETKSPTALMANKLFCSWVLALWVLIYIRHWLIYCLLLCISCPDNSFNAWKSYHPALATWPTCMSERTHHPCLYMPCGKSL